MLQTHYAPSQSNLSASQVDDIATQIATLASATSTQRVMYAE